MAMLTFSIGRSLGKAASTLFNSSRSSHQSLDLQQLQSSHKSKLPHDPPSQNDKAPDHQEVQDDDDDADDDDNQPDHPDDPRNETANDQLVPDDEKGPLVDGVEGDDLGVKPPPPGHLVQDPTTDTAEKTRMCYRKFEPGKLGSDKTLCVTDEFFFDISVGAEPIGTMKIGVFGDVVPKSAANFRALATCTGVFADDALCFKGDSFHRIVANFVAQGGSKATGRSIYGPTFREEKTKDHHSFLEHAEKGVVSWAEYPIGSQFFILIRDEAKYLDGNHVVFGIVTEGMDVLEKIHHAPRHGEEPSSRVSITDCGDAHSRI